MTDRRPQGYFNERPAELHRQPQPEPRTAAGRALLSPETFAKLRLFAREAMSVGWYSEGFFRAFIDEDDGDAFSREDARYFAALTPQIVLALLDKAEAAELAGGLDAAWAEAEATLPDIAWLELMGPNDPSEPDRLYVASYKRVRGLSLVSVGDWGYGRTPVEALRALVLSHPIVIPPGQDETPRTGEHSS